MNAVPLIDYSLESEWGEDSGEELGHERLKLLNSPKSKFIAVLIVTLIVILVGAFMIFGAAIWENY